MSADRRCVQCRFWGGRDGTPGEAGECALFSDWPRLTPEPSDRAALRLGVRKASVVPFAGPRVRRFTPRPTSGASSSSRPGFRLSARGRLRR